jgi:predicted DNA-binding ribbon-helix-helix protein
MSGATPDPGRPALTDVNAAGGRPCPKSGRKVTLECAMDVPLKRYTVTIRGAKTSLSLEEPFWLRLNEIARRQGVAIGEVVHAVDVERRHVNLSAALRQFVMQDCQNRLRTLEVENGGATARHLG